MKQVARIDDPSGANHFAYPSIAVNKFNDVLIGYTAFSSNSYPSAAYSLRVQSDPVRTIRNRWPYKPGIGLFYYDVDVGYANRWGDYSATQVDPLNDTDFWTIQEYAHTPNSTGTTNGDGRWGTWWAQVRLAVPSNDNFDNALEISGGQGSTNGIIYRATRETSETNHAPLFTHSRSIWYKWTAPTTGDATFNAYGSSLGLKLALAVYTGSSLGNLTKITYHSSAANTNASRLSFSAIEGTTYRIVLAEGGPVIEGADNTVVNWSQPTAPYFAIDPPETNIIAGEPLILESLALGIPTPLYQWYRNTNGTLIQGATNATFTKTAEMSDQTYFSVVASNSVGRVTSMFAPVWTYATGSAQFNDYSILSNYLKVNIKGVTTHAYTVQGTIDFTNWTAIVTNFASFYFTNADGSNAFKFFRVIY